jgi:hypothetical protein
MTRLAIAFAMVHVASKPVGNVDVTHWNSTYVQGIRLLFSGRQRALGKNSGYTGS